MYTFHIHLYKIDIQIIQNPIIFTRLNNSLSFESLQGHLIKLKQYTEKISMTLRKNSFSFG